MIKNCYDEYEKILSNSQLKNIASEAISQRMVNTNNELNILVLMTEKNMRQLKTTLLSELSENILQ